MSKISPLIAALLFAIAPVSMVHADENSGQQAPQGAAKEKMDTDKSGNGAAQQGDPAAASPGAGEKASGNAAAPAAAPEDAAKKSSGESSAPSDQQAPPKQESGAAVSQN